jgi:uncharacterized membrane protein YoaT (DUF817 family)
MTVVALDSTPSSVVRQLGDMFLKEALSCMFPFGVIFSLALSKVIHLPGIPRYDFIFVACCLMQIGMVVARLESLRELAVVSLFHLLGLAMEVNKTRAGSWSYPEFGYLKVWGVPLYSGFMYASVASYICQAYKRLDLKVAPLPPFWVSVLVAAVAYGNFFGRGYFPDIRGFVILAVLLVFAKTRASFTIGGVTRWMSLPIAFALIGGALWCAENVATYFGAWQYPYQRDGWTLVDGGKATSWFLLVLVCFVPVAALKSGGRRLSEPPNNS